MLLAFNDGGMMMEKPSSNHSSLCAIEIPDAVLGSIKNFRNFDPWRILDFQFHNGKLLIFMSEMDRLESMQEFRSTIEAFLYEVERAVGPETEAYEAFHFDPDFAELYFTVDRLLFEQDVSAEMIERSIVEDALKYQLYSRKPIGVTVYYKDAATDGVFLIRSYPQK